LGHLSLTGTFLPEKQRFFNKISTFWRFAAHRDPPARPAQGLKEPPRRGLTGSADHALMA